ncbi:MAG: carbohydrate porin [Phycisphaerae bacterium]
MRQNKSAVWLFLSATLLALLSTKGIVRAAYNDPYAPPSPAAREEAEETGPKGLLERDTLTDNWFGFGKKLEEQGLTVTLSATQIYQQNLHGGLSTHRRAGRYQGGYDLELTFDLEKLAKIPGGSVYVLGEGSWSNGIDPSSVGSIFGVNGDVIGTIPIQVSELWYEQSFLNEKVIIRAGKIDLTGGFECKGCPVAFDGSHYANDQTTQFLNGALVNNPTIPFPWQGLGAAAYVTPVDFWYVAAGAGDAEADARETGFNTAFHGSDRFFSIYETGLMPEIPSGKGDLRGAYRVGMWLDPRQERLDGEGYRNDNIGVYTSCDQMVLKEKNDKEDTQGLAAFFRWGSAPAQTSVIRCFWSVGAQYQGLLPDRDNDIVAFGVAQGNISPAADLEASHETALELYYNIEVTPWLHISPDVQYIFNPGGDAGNDAVVVGMRVLIAF